jgi:hypothetical protein
MEGAVAAALQGEDLNSASVTIQDPDSSLRVNFTLLHDEIRGLKNLSFSLA